MKGKFSSMWRVVIALVLVLSFSLVAAAPVSADVSSATVTVDPTTVDTNAEYTIEFTTTVALASTDTIVITFPEDTDVVDGAWTGDEATVKDKDDNTVDLTSIAGDSSARTVTITLAAALVAGDVTVTILTTGTTGDITNPSTAGVYALTVETNEETTAVASKGYAIGDPVRIVDSVDTDLDTVVNGASFYIHVTDGATVKMWNTHPAMVDTLEVTVETYDGVAIDGGCVTPTSTATYTATETDKDTNEFWTNAIDTGDLNVRPGYKLVVYPTGTTGADEAFIQAEISFDKSYYDVNETMTITLEDDGYNTDAATAQTGVTISDTCTLGINDIETGWDETGADTGVFTKSLKPSDNDWFGPGDTMTVTYTNSNTAPSGVEATAAVLMYSASSVKFDKGTYDVTDTSATITVTDPDKAGTGTIIGANCLVVENVTTGDSVSFSSLAESATAGEFTATVGFGTDTGELAINDGDQLQATYADPATPEDVSTAIAAVGYTVFLYDDTGVLDDSYTTIQEAIDDADVASGWTVKVSEAYNSTDETFPITINEAGLTVESIAGAASTTIDARGEGTAVSIAAIGVTVGGFTIETGGPGILIGAADATVQNNIITTEVPWSRGITVSSTGATISGNELDINSTMYVDSGVTDCTLSGNTFGAGINLALNNSGITITDNTIIGSEFEGICFDDKSNTGTYDDILIQGNTISQTTPVNPGDDVAGIYVRGDNVTNLVITGNDITDNEGVGIKITAATWGAGNAIKFNNITGNTDYGIETSKDVDATHNWWGTTVSSEIAAMITGAGTTTYDPWLGASIVRGAAAFAYNADSLDAETEVGVQVSGVDNTSTAAEIGAAVYTDNPKAEFTAVDNGFVDVYVIPDAIVAADEIILKFYAGDEDSVVYAWNELYGEWEECTLQDYSSYGGYIWVKVHSELADVVTVPTIEALAGLPFAISTEEAVALESIAASPESVSLDVDETQQLTVTATYSDASTADVTAEASYESSDTSVATVSTGGLITGVAEGSATVTVSYTEDEITKTTTVPVTVTVFDVYELYDADGDGVISKTEALTAVADYFDDVITKEQALLVIVEYMG